MHGNVSGIFPVNLNLFAAVCVSHRIDSHHLTHVEHEPEDEAKFHRALHASHFKSSELYSVTQNLNFVSLIILAIF